jgi:hypothetical protein
MKQLQRVDIAKLKTLAKFLETVPVDQFDLGDWELSPYKPAKKFGPFTIQKECGFAGCAMGWAAHAKLFDGFRFDRFDDIDEDPDVQYGDLYFGWDAVASLFNLKERQCFFLFAEPSYDDRPPSREVANRIHKFVKKIESRIIRYKSKQAIAKWLEEIKCPIEMLTA